MATKEESIIDFGCRKKRRRKTAGMIRLLVGGTNREILTLHPEPNVLLDNELPNWYTLNMTTNKRNLIQDRAIFFNGDVSLSDLLPTAKAIFAVDSNAWLTYRLWNEEEQIIIHFQRPETDEEMNNRILAESPKEFSHEEVMREMYEVLKKRFDCA